MRTSLRLRPLPLLAPSSSGALCLHLDQQDSRGVNAAPEPVVEFTRPMLLERRRRCSWAGWRSGRLRCAAIKWRCRCQPFRLRYGALSWTGYSSRCWEDQRRECYPVPSLRLRGGRGPEIAIVPMQRPAAVPSKHFILWRASVLFRHHAAQSLVGVQAVPRAPAAKRMGRLCQRPFAGPRNS